MVQFQGIFGSKRITIPSIVPSICIAHACCHIDCNYIVIMLYVIILIVGAPCQLGPFGGGGGGGGGRERLKFLFKNNFLKGLASPSYLDDLIKKSIKTKFKEELFLYPTKTWDQY